YQDNGCSPMSSTEWISADARLPTDDERVLVAVRSDSGSRFVTIAWYYAECGWSWGRIRGSVTHPERRICARAISRKFPFPKVPVLENALRAKRRPGRELRIMSFTRVGHRGSASCQWSVVSRQLQSHGPRTTDH